MLSQIHSSLSKSSSNFRKYRKDIELSSQLLMSVKNITHGMFLHKGGYYSKLVYDRKVSESNAKSTQVQSKQLYSDLHHARKLMYEFLDRISCQSGKPISKSQPKRLSLSKNKNVKTSGSVTKLPYRQLQINFDDKRSLTIKSPSKPPYYSHPKFFSCWKIQFLQLYTIHFFDCCQKMKVMVLSLYHMRAVASLFNITKGWIVWSEFHL